jgi:hypothetical protein
LRTAADTWTDHRTNTEIANELNITPVLDKIYYYKRNWIQNVSRMPLTKLSRLIKTTAQKAKGTKEDH